MCVTGMSGNNHNQAHVAEMRVTCKADVGCTEKISLAEGRAFVYRISFLYDILAICHIKPNNNMQITLSWKDKHSKY